MAIDIPNPLPLTALLVGNATGGRRHRLHDTSEGLRNRPNPERYTSSVE
jgi:hypothetical protein